MRSPIVLALLFLGLLHLNCTASAARQKLCSQQTGAIVARSKCKQGETIVTLAGLLSTTAEKFKQTTAPVGPVGVAGPAGSAGPSGNAGPQGKTGLTSIVRGPRGKLDFSACHKIVSGPAFSSGELTLSANCNSQNEFLYDEELSLTGTGAFVQSFSRNSSNGANGEVMPYGILVTSTSVAATSYSLTVQALCCPR